MDWSGLDGKIVLVINVESETGELRWLQSIQTMENNTKIIQSKNFLYFLSVELMIPVYLDTKSPFSQFYHIEINSAYIELERQDNKPGE